MFYVLHGDEEYLKAERVADLKSRVAGDAAGGLNVSELDGRSTTVVEVLNAARAMPFLAERRLVIVYGLLGYLAKEEQSRAEELESLVEGLEDLPETARLLLVEDTKLPANHPVVKLAARSEVGHELTYSKLEGPKLEAWVTSRAQSKGPGITGSAARLLIRDTRGNLRQLDNWLEVLAASVGYSRPIDDDAVREHVPVARDAEIFELVDSIGLRQADRALEQVQLLLDEGYHPLQMLAMIARQTRMLITVSEQSRRRVAPPDILRQLGLRTVYTGLYRKLHEQSRRFGLAELEHLQREVVALDYAIKTGLVEPEVGLQILVVRACAKLVPESS
ncbi:MAG: DNA polymerase III subunit delta [Anaerolineae bacterium]|nr:DNA polymerase III subunit delta [Anaerolineae bacterium]